MSNGPTQRAQSIFGRRFDVESASKFRRRNILTFFNAFLMSTMPAGYVQFVDGQYNLSLSTLLLILYCVVKMF